MQKLRVMTQQGTPMRFDQGMEKLSEVQREWVNAFRMASIQNKRSELDRCLRKRLRDCI